MKFRYLPIFGLLLASFAFGSDTQRNMEQLETTPETYEVTFEPIITPSWFIDKLEAMRQGDTPPEPPNPFDIINLGKMLWDIIEENKPSTNIEYDFANALPKGVESSMELEHFSPLQLRSYNITVKNSYGLVVVKVDYGIVHRYGGAFEGRGYYLDTVTALPQQVFVNWGYKVDMKAKMVTVSNIGTKEDPIASLVLQSTLSWETTMQKAHQNHLYEFRGDSPEVKIIGS